MVNSVKSNTCVYSLAMCDATKRKRASQPIVMENPGYLEYTCSTAYYKSIWPGRMLVSFELNTKGIFLYFYKLGSESV